MSIKVNETAVKQKCLLSVQFSTAVLGVSKQRRDATVQLPTTYDVQNTSSSFETHLGRRWHSELGEDLPGLCKELMDVGDCLQWPLSLTEDEVIKGSPGG